MVAHPRADSIQPPEQPTNPNQRGQGYECGQGQAVEKMLRVKVGKARGQRAKYEEGNYCTY